MIVIDYNQQKLLAIEEKDLGIWKLLAAASRLHHPALRRSSSIANVHGS
jgi:hypothetical protein